MARAAGSDGRRAPAGRRRCGVGPPLDRDGDSKVSHSEFDGPAEHFTDFDRDRDGYITASEAPTGPPPQKR